MKLLLENWRQYVKQEVESFLPHGTVRDINMIGSSTLSPEEQDRQDMEKHGHIQAERDIDIEVQIADITREEAEEWAFSNEAERLEIENNYDVQLTIVENWRKFLTEQDVSPVTGKPYPKGVLPKDYEEYDDWAAGKFSPADASSPQIAQQKAQAGKEANIQPGDLAQLKTVGDLRKAVKVALTAKRKGQGKEALKDLAKSSVTGALLGAADSLKDLILQTYKLPDDKSTGTGLDALNIDDEISAIIDDQVENRFLNWLVKSLEGQEDEVPLQKLNMDRLLQKFLMQQFNRRTIKSPELKE